MCNINYVKSNFISVPPCGKNAKRIGKMCVCKTGFPDGDPNDECCKLTYGYRKMTTYIGFLFLRNVQPSYPTFKLPLRVTNI